MDNRNDFKLNWGTGLVFVAACRRKEVWEGGGHTESSGGQMWKLRHLDGTIDLGWWGREGD